MKSQLKDTQGDQTAKSHEMVALRGQLRDSQNHMTEHVNKLQTTQDTLTSLRREGSELRAQIHEQSQTIHAKNREILTERENSQKKDIVISELQSKSERIRNEVNSSKEDFRQQQQSFEEEKAMWLDEKEKVIRYQKQLQLNYVQMYRRHRTLEQEIENLTLELESRNDQGHQHRSLPPTANRLPPHLKPVKNSTESHC